MFKFIWRADVEMILRGLVSVPELARHAEYHPSRYGKNQFNGKTVNIDGVNYIPKLYLTSQRDMVAAKKCTNLDDYLPLKYCANYLFGVHVKTLSAKVKFQINTKEKIYDIKKISNQYFFKIPEELQQKMKKHVSLMMVDYRRFNNYEDVKDSYIFGDSLIVFM